MPLLPAILLSATVASLGWAFRSLTLAGAVAATGVGTAILWGTGWPGLVVLGTFFAGSSAISHVAPDRTRDFDAKGARRDALQVVANGGAAAVGALIPGAGLWIVATSLAAAAADTWATSAGGWSRSLPRLLTTFQPVPAGTSGAVSLVGTIGAICGAATVSLAASLTARLPVLFPVALALGMLGMFADSALGALVQGRFHCDDCDLPTERRVHRCGRPSRPIGGYWWLSNDGVNAITTLVAAAGGFAAWRLWGG